jgi:hypothetical protein
VEIKVLHMTKMMNSPKAPDLLAVRSRISWGAIAAGAMVALSIYVVLSILGVALGIEVAVRGASAHLGAGAAIYSILTLLLAMFFGGWTTSRLAVGESKLEAVLYGMILWGTLFVGMVWLLSAGIRTGFGAMIGMASATDAAFRDADTESSPSPGLAQALRQRYATELGGDRFVEDLKKAGFSEEQARKAEVEIKGRIDRIRDDPSSLPEVTRDVASRPEIQRAAGLAAERTREASWWTLIGVVISMATVIVGSLVGSGELLQPVPILGVRRVPAPRH